MYSNILALFLIPQWPTCRLLCIVSFQRFLKTNIFAPGVDVAAFSQWIGQSEQSARIPAQRRSWAEQIHPRTRPMLRNFNFLSVCLPFYLITPQEFSPRVSRELYRSQQLIIKLLILEGPKSSGDGLHREECGCSTSDGSFGVQTYSTKIRTKFGSIFVFLFLSGWTSSCIFFHVCLTPISFYDVESVFFAPPL